MPSGGWRLRRMYAHTHATFCAMVCPCPCLEGLDLLKLAEALLQAFTGLSAPRRLHFRAAGRKTMNQPRCARASLNTEGTNLGKRQSEAPEPNP